MRSHVRAALLSLWAAILLVQAPLTAQAIAAADAAARHVDRAQLMRDVDTLSASAFEGRRAGPSTKGCQFVSFRSR